MEVALALHKLTPWQVGGHAVHSDFLFFLAKARVWLHSLKIFCDRSLFQVGDAIYTANYRQVSCSARQQGAFRLPV